MRDLIVLDESGEALYREALETSRDALARQVKGKVAMDAAARLLTVVLNFMVPQFSFCGRFYLLGGEVGMESPDDVRATLKKEELLF